MSDIVGTLPYVKLLNFSPCSCFESEPLYWWSGNIYYFFSRPCRNKVIGARCPGTDKRFLEFRGKGFISVSRVV